MKNLQGRVRVAADNPSGHPAGNSCDEGYVLLAVLVLVFLVLLSLTIAAPKIATDLKRQRELETVHRAQQYDRAIRVFYRKFGHYPPSIEALEKTNNQRFLRQRYLDPLTGKDDWRLIQVGQNKTTVKGFFGKDLPGIGGGLGAAAGMQSNMGSSSTGSSTGSAFGGSSTGSAFGGNSGSGFGSGPNAGQTGSQAGSQTGSAGNQTGGGTASGTGSGVNSQDATTFGGGNTGPIMGVGVPKDGAAIITVNEQTNYQDWEFLYDPRIEQLYAKANIMGGAPTASGGSGTGLPSADSNNGAFGSNPATGTSGSGTTGYGSTGSGSPTTPTSPQ
jgi:type II secretory pathway pseudopilin PulG